MQKLLLLTFLLVLAFIPDDVDGFIRIRRVRIRVPRIRIPPVRIRIPPVRIRIPPVRIRVPPVRIRSIIREVGDGFETVGKVLAHGVDILTKGCCGLYPSYCDNRKEFENRQKDIKAKSAQMDKDWAALKSKMDAMKTININNQEVYRQVRRVTLASTLTVITLDPLVLDRINNITNELKKEIVKKNQTVLNYGINDIGKEVEKADEQPKTEILDATGIGGFTYTEGAVQMTADMFRLVKLDGVANFLEGNVLNSLAKAKHEVSKLFGFHHLEKLAEKNKAVGIALGVVKFYNDYLNVFGGVFKVMELFGKFTAWITDLVTCKKRKNEMATAIVSLREEHAKILASYVKMPATKITIDTNLKNVVAEARSSSLLTNLKEVQKIAQHSSTNSKAMQNSVKIIQNYRNLIGKSSTANIIKLQKALIYAVGNVTYNAECYQRKLATYKAVSDNCRLGKGSLKDLYNQALTDFRTNSDECKTESGLPYTTLTDVEKYVKKKADKLNFEFECLLNSGIKLPVVCNHLGGGYTLSEAAIKASVNESIAELYKSSCPIVELSPLSKSYICKWKDAYGVTATRSRFPFTEDDEFEQALNQC